MNNQQSPDWVIQIEAVNGPCYLLEGMLGDPGRTSCATLADRFETENLAQEVCTSLRMKYRRSFTPICLV
jgi:hypothetical protein